MKLDSNKENIMTSSKSKLAALKSIFGSQENEGRRESLPNNYYPFWNMAVGQKAVVRFLPDANENNERGFLVEKSSHILTVNGQKRTVPCMTMYDEECPVCKVSRDFYNAKDEVNGKKYWRKRQYIAQALIVEDPLPANEQTGETHEGQVRGITLGYQIYNIIKEAFASDELEDIPYDLENGYDFIIKKTEQGQYATYAVGTKFKNNPRSLTDEEIAVVEDSMVDLSTLLPKNIGIDKLTSMLDADLNGEAFEENSNSDDSDDDGEETTTRARTTTRKAPVKAAKAEETETDSESSSDASTDVDSMLAAIRARRAGAK